MALDTTQVSTRALNRHNGGDNSKFTRLTALVQVGKGGQIATTSSGYTPGILVPIKKEEYGLVTDPINIDPAIIKQRYFQKLDGYLLNRNYGIFSHDRDGTRYAAVPHFLQAGTSKEFATLIKTNNGAFDFEPFSLFIKTLKSSYPDQNPADFYYSTTGPFHVLELAGPPLFYDYVFKGIIYKNDEDQFPGNPLAPFAGHKGVQWVYNGPGSPNSLEFLTVTPYNGDGFETLIHIIQPNPNDPNGIIVSKKAGFDETKPGADDGARNLDGFSIIAYHETKDLLLSIVKKDQLRGKVDDVVDMLQLLGFTHVTFMDGGGSCFLYEYTGSGGGTLHVRSSSLGAVQFERDAAGGSLKIAYGIRDILLNTTT
jgi:hypothetical protein